MQEFVRLDIRKLHTTRIRPRPSARPGTEGHARDLDPAAPRSAGPPLPRRVRAVLRGHRRRLRRGPGAGLCPVALTMVRAGRPGGRDRAGHAARPAAGRAGRSPAPAHVPGDLRRRERRRLRRHRVRARLPGAGRLRAPGRRGLRPVQRRGAGNAAVVDRARPAGRGHLAVLRAGGGRLHRRPAAGGSAAGRRRGSGHCRRQRRELPALRRPRARPAHGAGERRRRALGLAAAPGPRRPGDRAEDPRRRGAGRRDDDRGGRVRRDERR